ncbi:hypothetical protein AVEN_91612-1, partial [Araneus ventricosus]
VPRRNNKEIQNGAALVALQYTAPRVAPSVGRTIHRHLEATGSTITASSDENLFAGTSTPDLSRSPLSFDDVQCLPRKKFT